MKKIYIIHGYSASPEHHWFKWLAHKITSEYPNIEILTPTMPTSNEPKLIEWLGELKKIKTLDENTYFITHSLGGITLLNYLDNIKTNITIGGAILVAPFNKKLSNIPVIDAFINNSLSYEKIISFIKKRIVILALDDYIVPANFSKETAYNLQANIYEMQKGGHFLESDGFSSFLEVYYLLKLMLEN